MLKNILVGFVSAMSAFLTYVWLQPAAFTVTRSTTIAAPPAAVFAEIGDFKRWNAWSPWAKKDPAAKVAYSPVSTGEGAAFAWSGNREIGEGKMTIVESRPNEKLGLHVEMVKPFKGSSLAAFTLQPAGQGTSVTWTLSGENGFFERAAMMMIGIDMDEMVGADYEKGLANLKAVVEGAPKG